MKENEKSIGQGRFVRSFLGFIHMHWRIFIQCSFSMAIVLELLSIIVLSLNWGVMQFTSLAVTFHISTLIVLASMILGCIGFLLANSQAIKSVEERYKNVLQEALGTDRYYHVWSGMTREIKMAESIAISGLNSLLLAVTFIVGLFSLAYILSTFPNSHPFYQLVAPQMLSIFLAVVFLYERRRI